MMSFMSVGLFQSSTAFSSSLSVGVCSSSHAAAHRCRPAFLQRSRPSAARMSHRSARAGASFPGFPRQGDVVPQGGEQQPDGKHGRAVAVIPRVGGKPRGAEPDGGARRPFPQVFVAFQQCRAQNVARDIPCRPFGEEYPRKLVGIGPEARIGQDPQHERGSLRPQAFEQRGPASRLRVPEPAVPPVPGENAPGIPGQRGKADMVRNVRQIGIVVLDIVPLIFGQGGRGALNGGDIGELALVRGKRGVGKEPLRLQTVFPPPDLHGFALLEVHDHPAFLFPPVFPERQARGHLVGAQFRNDVQREPAFSVRRRVPRAHAVQQEQGGGVGAGCGDVQGGPPLGVRKLHHAEQGGRRAQRFAQDGRVRIALQQDMQERRLFVAERPLVRMQQSLFHGGGVLGTAQGEELRHVRIAGPPAFAGKQHAEP